MCFSNTLLFQECDWEAGDTGWQHIFSQPFHIPNSDPWLPGIFTDP